MSFLDNVTGLLESGLGTYEKLQLAQMGVSPTASAPNNGTSGGAAGLPDQSIVDRAQTVGPVAPVDGGNRVTLFGIAMDKSLLQLTGLVLLLLFVTGKLKLG